MLELRKARGIGKEAMRKARKRSNEKSKKKTYTPLGKVSGKKVGSRPKAEPL